MVLTAEGPRKRQGSMYWTAQTVIPEASEDSTTNHTLPPNGAIVAVARLEQVQLEAEADRC